MKVLLVNKFFYRKGGSETYLFALAEGLHEQGHEVAFFSMCHPSNAESSWNKYFVSEKEYNGKISVVQKAKAALTIAYSFEARNKFEALLNDFQPDVIHLNLVHRQITFAILDAPYLKKHRVPVVYTSHEYSLICPAYTMINGHRENCEACIHGAFGHVVSNVCTKGSMAKSLLSGFEAEFLKHTHSYDKIDLIIACSNFMKKKLDEGGYGNRTIALQNFLSRAQVKMGECVSNGQKYGDELSGKRPYFLFFGRLSKEKGVLSLLRAFIASCRPVASDSCLPQNWDLHIVGEGPEYASIVRLLDEAPRLLRPRIIISGYKSGIELYNEIGNARFSVLPSEWYENMPYSGLESLASQTPVIGGDIGGIPEIVLEGKTGFLFPSGDIESLSSRLIAAANLAESEYSAMQHECQDYIQTRCSQNRYIEDLVEQYRQLCDGSNSKLIDNCMTPEADK